MTMKMWKKGTPKQIYAWTLDTMTLGTECVASTPFGELVFCRVIAHAEVPDKPQAGRFIIVEADDSETDLFASGNMSDHVAQTLSYKLIAGEYPVDLGRRTRLMVFRVNSPHIMPIGRIIAKSLRWELP